MSTSTLQIIRTLIAKDWRLFRAPIFGLLIVALVAWLIALMAPRASHGKEGFDDWRLFASAVALHLTGVFAAVFGGISIAGERNARTGDFVSLLPVTRRQIIFSKWMVSALILFPFVAFHAAVATLTQLHRWKSEQMFELQHDLADWGAQAVLWLGCTTSFFGVAWLAGSFSSSAVISACASIAISLVVVMVSAFVTDPATHVLQDSWIVPFLTTIPVFLLGMGGVISGTLYYLKRIEP